MHVSLQLDDPGAVTGNRCWVSTYEDMLWELYRAQAEGPKIGGLSAGTAQVTSLPYFGVLCQIWNNSSFRYVIDYHLASA
jgi:hypothetical protein